MIKKASAGLALVSRRFFDRAHWPRAWSRAWNKVEIARDRTLLWKIPNHCNGRMGGWKLVAQQLTWRQRQHSTSQKAWAYYHHRVRRRLCAGLAARPRKNFLATEAIWAYVPAGMIRMCERIVTMPRQFLTAVIIVTPVPRQYNI